MLVPNASPLARTTADPLLSRQAMATKAKKATKAMEKKAEMKAMTIMNEAMKACKNDEKEEVIEKEIQKYWTKKLAAFRRKHGLDGRPAAMKALKDH